MNKPSGNTETLTRVIEVLIRIVILVWIVGWSILILKPFVSIILWSMIIAISVSPWYHWFKKKFRGRGGLASTLVTMVLLAFIICPVLFLSSSLFDGIENLKEVYKS